MFFCENRQEASFYIKKQMKKKNQNLSFKNYNFGPQKRGFGFEEKNPKKCFLHVLALIHL